MNSQSLCCYACIALFATGDTCWSQQVVLDFGPSVSYLHPAAAGISDPRDAKNGADYAPSNSITQADFDATWFLLGYSEDQLDYVDGTSITWQQGNLPIGFGRIAGFDDGLTGHSGLATELALPDSGERLTTYYRIPFQVTTDVAGPIMMDYLIDDGATIYLDGQPVARINCCFDPHNQEPIPITVPPGFDARAVEAGNESTLALVLIAPDGLAAGEHLLAISLHQSAPTTSDAGLDFRLYHVPEPAALNVAWLAILGLLRRRQLSAGN